MKKRQTGFSLVSAIFLLVVLAFLGAAMVTFSANQQQSAAMDVMGSRAYQAARAGVEFGAYRVLRVDPAACADTILPAGTLAGTLSGFAVVVTCVATPADDVNAATGVVTVYNLTSTATQGVIGQPDYVERRIQASIAR